MRIIDILDRLEDRITEAVKTFYVTSSKKSLEFDIELIEKDVELVKELIKKETTK